MPFIPHTQDDITKMLSELSCLEENEIFSDIPSDIPRCHLDTIDHGLSEQELSQLMAKLSAKDEGYVNYIGAGAYEHYIPKTVWALTSRGEFYSSYTPYQAEASQGILQIFYEFQTFIARLTAMDVANCSLYDASTALAESILMIKRIRQTSAEQSSTVLIPEALSPRIQETLATLLKTQHCLIETVPTHPSTGLMSIDTISEEKIKTAKAIVIAFPNYYGCLEDVHYLTNLAHQYGLLVIALVNPLALSLLTPPGQWGEKGADIVIGDAQPFGIPLSSGGPYAGFIATKKEYLRQIPGRIVGRTTDKNNKPCFTLTLQAREQHIRREKSTSNICTNQGLLVIASSIYIALMGETGLRRIALSCHELMRYFIEHIQVIKNIRVKYTAPFFHEIVLSFPKPVQYLLDHLRIQHKIIGGICPRETTGIDCSPCTTQDLLVCITETKTTEDIDIFIAEIQSSMELAS